MLSWPFSNRGRLRALRQLLEHLAAHADSGIGVELWDGSVVRLGRDADAQLRLVIHSAATISSLLRWPTLDNFVRHYAAGHIEFCGGDLLAFYENAQKIGFKQALAGTSKWWLLWQMLPFIFHWGRSAGPVRHAHHGATPDRPVKCNDRELVRFHYDVGNEFYQLILDPEMQYSCAYFRNWDHSLAQSQADKLEMICRKLRLQPGQRLLDVGCGWGGLACYAARNYGVHVHGVTLSAVQADFARAKVRRLGLEDRVTIECRDFLELDGPYDRVCSIGMMEHVGIANYPRYFQKMRALLHDRGILLNHCIHRGAKAVKRRFRPSRPEHRFIQKYIFPGGELDHIGHTLEVLEQCNFQIHDVEGWRQHYALTLKNWSRNLQAHRTEAERLVGPEMVRMWAAYLAGFSVAFQRESLRIFQVVAVKRFAKGAAPILPPTRDDLYLRPFLPVQPQADAA